MRVLKDHNKMDRQIKRGEKDAKKKCARVTSGDSPMIVEPKIQR